MSSKKENTHHIINRPFEAYKGGEPYIFVSYAHKDSDLVYPEITRLHELGYRLWYDEGIELGVSWSKGVAQALEKCSLFIVFITPNSVDSDNVCDEINLAIDEKIQFLTIHLLETKLSSELKLRIGRKQALLKYEIPLETYEKKLLEAIPVGILGEPPDKNKPESNTIDTDAEFARLVREGRERKDRGDYGGAAADFREALKYRPNDAHAWYNIGNICDEQGEYDEAIKYYSRVINIDNDHIAAIYGRGTCLYNVEKYEEALESFVRVLEINPRHKKSADKKLALEKIIGSRGSAPNDASPVKTSTDEIKGAPNGSAENAANGDTCVAIPKEPVPGELLSINIGNDATIELVWVPPGTFLMGSHGGEKDRFEWEGPVHTVNITKGYWLGKYPVTQRQWKAIMDDNPSGFQKSDNYPVEKVSWNDCLEFISILNTVVRNLKGFPENSNQFRFPTEAEWEYACRAGTSTRFYWGEDLDGSEAGKYCWFLKNSKEATHPVGQKMPNHFGLYDMSGNVSEWCGDWYGAYKEGAVTDPRGPESGTDRVNRGGHWSGRIHQCRSANRGGSHPSVKLHNLGLRLALS